MGVGSALEMEVSEDALLSFVLPAHALHPKIRNAESKRAVICFFFILLYLFFILKTIYKHKRPKSGSLNAINNALRAYTGAEYTLQVFTQHSMQGQGSQSVAASYIGLEKEDGSMFWGAGTDTDVVKANTKALLSAYNNMIKGGN